MKSMAMTLRWRRQLTTTATMFSPRRCFLSIFADNYCNFSSCRQSTTVYLLTFDSRLCAHRATQAHTHIYLFIGIELHLLRSQLIIYFTYFNYSDSQIKHVRTPGLSVDCWLLCCTQHCCAGWLIGMENWAHHNDYIHQIRPFVTHVNAIASKFQSFFSFYSYLFIFSFWFLITFEVVDGIIISLSGIRQASERANAIEAHETS